MVSVIAASSLLVFLAVPDGRWPSVGLALGAAVTFGAIGGLLTEISERRRKDLAQWTHYNVAAETYAPVLQWKAVRARPEFWAELGAREDGGTFEVECAELMAAILQTDEVALTRKSDDYGTDIMACTDRGLVVAQCKLSAENAPKIGHVRELAGTKAYFEARQGLFFSLTKIGDDRTQAGAYAEKCDLQYWDAAAIAAFAQELVKR